MAMKSKHTTTPKGASTLNFEDFELRNTMHEFLQEDKKSNDGVINFATISGFAMLFIGLTFMLQLIGLNVGPDLSSLVEMLPLIGGVLVTLVGFGFFVGDRKKEEQDKKKSDYSSKANYDYDFDVHGSQMNVKSKSKKTSTVSNDLDFEQFAPKSGYSSKSSSSKTYIDPYGYKQSRSKSRRLFRSRTDKKLAGVCGGLAKYFGISPTAVRLLTVLSFFMWGTSLIIYIGLAIAMPKEPYDLIDDFDY